MLKKSTIKSAALILCLALVLVAVPGLNSAERRAPRTGFTRLLMQPSLLLSSLFPFLSPIVDSGTRVPLTTAAGPVGKVRPTGEISIPKPGTGD